MMSQRKQHRCKKKPPLRKPQSYFHNTGSTKEKVLEVNPYLERNMTIHKRGPLYILSYTRRKPETTLDKLFYYKKINTNSHNLSYSVLHEQYYGAFKEIPITHHKLYSIMLEFAF